MLLTFDFVKGLANNPLRFANLFINVRLKAEVLEPGEHFRRDDLFDPVEIIVLRVDLTVNAPIIIIGAPAFSTPTPLASPSA